MEVLDLWFDDSLVTFTVAKNTLLLEQIPGKMRPIAEQNDVFPVFLVRIRNAISVVQ